MSNLPSDSTGIRRKEFSFTSLLLRDLIMKTLCSTGTRVLLLAGGGGTEGGVGARSLVSQVMTTKSQILNMTRNCAIYIAPCWCLVHWLHCLDLPTQINIGLIKAQLCVKGVQSLSEFLSIVTHYVMLSIELHWTLGLSLASTLHRHTTPTGGSPPPRLVENNSSQYYFSEWNCL